MAPAGLTKILYRVLVGGVLMWLLAVAISTAAREYSGAGALLVFGILVYLFGAVLSSNRYTLCTGLVLSAVLICLDQADRLKFSYVQSHLNLYDLILVGNMVAHWDTTVAWQYMGEVWPFLLWFGIAVGTAPLALRLERTIGGDGAWARSARHRAFCSCVVLLGTQLIILGNSQYLRTTSTFHAFLTATEPGGLRVANVLNFGLRMAQTWSNLRKDAETLGRSSLLHTATGPSPQMCVSCPDLVFVHLESTFDPNLLEEYSRAPGYLSRMAAEGEQRSLGGSLLVNTYGGGSWISEFELLCGINHALFGDAGLYPHLFVSPFLKGCIPAYLKSQGYRTFAIYTTDPFFAGAGTGFRNYGVDTFLDNQAVGAPVHWREQRDIYFIDALRRLLSEPSDTPRFIFVSTNSNHGPHGNGFGREGPLGPFDRNLAGSSEVSDYIGRLNETYSTMLRLERDLTNGSRPVAVLYYGDHQPSFRKAYAQGARRQFKRDLPKITFFRMARSYGDMPSRRPDDGRPTPVVSLAGLFL